jgi:NADH:ubiquinone oxidoreductase subunit 4 (subunit M)
MALLALLLIPLLTAMVLLVATPTRYARGIALFSSLVSLALTLWLWSNYQGIPVQALDVEWARPGAFGSHWGTTGWAC